MFLYKNDGSFTLIHYSLFIKREYTNTLTLFMYVYRFVYIYNVCISCIVLSMFIYNSR